MDYNSIVFREFTHESLQRIERYRQEEAERQIISEDDNDKRHCTNRLSKDKPIDLKRVPNKELAVGQTLPRVLQNKFPDELIGKPIEEIDSYYRGEYVWIIFLKGLFYTLNL
jgi:hypothetical protein